MIKALAILFVLLMTSCTSEVYDMNQPRDFQLDASFSPEEQAAIIASLDMLSEKTGQHIGISIGIDREDRTIRRVVGQKGGEWGGHRQIVIGTVWLTPENAAAFAAHEMGHDLGFNHVKGSSLMFPYLSCDGFCWSAQDQAECERVGVCK